MLKVEGLWMEFPMMDLPALRDVSLEVCEGEFVSLVGPSGCGKTTLLRITAGLLAPTRGEVVIDDEPNPGPSRDKAVVFQQINLFPWRTALANASYGLELQGVPRSERRERAMEYLRLLNLERFADHYPAEMSGGMQQRVGIARALVMEPKILLMDEPFGALDALTREHLQNELQSLSQQLGLTVLFVTHSIDEAVYLSDRIIVMGIRPGRIVRVCPVDLKRPRRYEVRGESVFGGLRNDIWHLLAREQRQTQEELA